MRYLSVLLLAASLVAIPLVASAGDVYVPGYYRGDGTYVQPHYRSAPNRNPYDNWSTKGNVNPYTGKKGYRNPVDVYRDYAPPRQPTYPKPSYGIQTWPEYRVPKLEPSYPSKGNQGGLDW